MSFPEEMLTVGVISDTHGLLRPEAVEALQGVDHILHAGDIGDAGILKVLRQIAPVTAIRGNVDISGECAELPATEVVELGGLLFYLVHSLADLDINPMAAGVAAVISGHSHRAEIRLEDVLYLNPGSAGPRRFNLPITLANIQIVNRGLHPRIIPI
jgi:putative phosphoesterase